MIFKIREACRRSRPRTDFGRDDDDVGTMRKRVEPPPGSLHSTWPRGLYVIVVSVILNARWYVDTILEEAHNDTTETTHVREHASRQVRASIVSRTGSPSIPSKISSCLCRFGAERLVSAMHFTGNQWLELKATVSRWRPVLSHRLLPPPPPPPPRPGNTDPRTVFPRSWWSCPLVNIPWTTETILGHWLDTRFSLSHPVLTPVFHDRFYGITSRRTEITRNIYRNVLSPEASGRGWVSLVQRDSGMIRARATTARSG